MPTMQFGEAADYGVFAAPHESSRRCDPARLLRLDRNLCAPAGIVGYPDHRGNARPRGPACDIGSVEG